MPHPKHAPDGSCDWCDGYDHGHAHGRRLAERDIEDLTRAREQLVDKAKYDEVVVEAENYRRKYEQTLADLRNYEAIFLGMEHCPSPKNCPEVHDRYGRHGKRNRKLGDETWKRRYNEVARRHNDLKEQNDGLKAEAERLKKCLDDEIKWQHERNPRQQRRIDQLERELKDARYLNDRLQHQPLRRLTVKEAREALYRAEVDEALKSMPRVAMNLKLPTWRVGNNGEPCPVCRGVFYHDFDCKELGTPVEDDDA